MLNEVQKKWLYRALIALIFIFAFAIRANNLGGKNGMHIDEYWSFILSEYKEVGWTEDIPAGTYNVGELKAMVYAPSDSSLKGAFSDVFKLWETNRDSPHTNIYYSALRLSLVGVDGSAGLMKELMFRAGLLNLLTFTAVFIAYFVFLRTILPKKGFILLGLVVLSLNPFDVGNVLFFRPYMLQTLFVVTFITYLVHISKQIELSIYKDSWQNLLKFAFAMSLMLWTGYYNFIFGFFIGIAFVLFVLKPHKELKLVPFFFMASVVAVSFCAIYYQDFLKGFYASRATKAIDNFISIKDSLFHIYESAVKYNFQWVFYLLPFVLVFAFLIFKKSDLSLFKLVKKYFWLIASVLISCIFIFFISPIKMLRYFVPYLPICLIFIPLAWVMIKNKICQKACGVLIVGIFVLSSIFSVQINELFLLNYKYNHYDNDDYSALYRKDIPVYFSRIELATNYSGLVIHLPLLHDYQQVTVCDTALTNMSEADAFNKMRELYSMPDEFVLFFDEGVPYIYKYKAHTCELKD